MKCKNTFSIIIVVLLVIVGVALRIFGMGNVVQESVYFDMAKVAEGQGIPTSVNGPVYVYLQLLHLIFLVFGNKWEVAIWLQIILQLIAGGFLYSGVRKLTGTLPAVIMLGILMVSPLAINQALILSPENLFFLVFSLILYICAKIIKKVLGARKKVAVERLWEDGKMEACLEAMSMDITERETEDKSEEVPQVKFIENPLPLPKKHVKKVLDYDREIEDGQEDFDVEIDEDDDFDI